MNVEEEVSSIVRDVEISLSPLSPSPPTQHPPSTSTRSPIDSLASSNPSPSSIPQSFGSRRTYTVQYLVRERAFGPFIVSSGVIIMDMPFKQKEERPIRRHLDLPDAIRLIMPGDALPRHCHGRCHKLLVDGLTVGKGQVSPEDLYSVIKKRIERILIRTEGGSYQQRILIDYLKGIQSRAEDIVKVLQEPQQ